MLLSNVIMVQLLNLLPCLSISVLLRLIIGFLDIQHPYCCLLTYETELYRLPHPGYNITIPSLPPPPPQACSSSEIFRRLTLHSIAWHYLASHYTTLHCIPLKDIG